MQGLYIVKFVFHGYGILLVCHISDFLCCKLIAIDMSKKLKHLCTYEVCLDNPEMSLGPTELKYSIYEREFIILKKNICIIYEEN